MLPKQDYSTAVLHMVSLLQESTVQRLFRIECNTTFRNKKKKRKSHWKFTFSALLVLPQPFWSIKGTSELQLKACAWTHVFLIK